MSGSCVSLVVNILNKTKNSVLLCSCLCHNYDVPVFADIVSINSVSNYDHIHVPYFATVDSSSFL